MSDETRFIGIDTQPDRTLVARISRLAGRPIIEYLGSEEPEQTETGESTPIRRMISIPDSRTCIRHLRVAADETYSAAERAKFEFAQSLLEPEQSFDIAIHPSHTSDRFVGVAVRRTDLAELLSDTTDAVQGGQARSIALWRGFTTFCDAGAGEFHALVNMTADSVLLLLLHQGKPARITQLKRSEPATADRQFKALAGEIKTTLSFHLNACFQEGITVPLSRVYVSVSDADQPLLTALRQLSSIEVKTPTLTRFSLSPEVTISEEKQHQYLVPLGLALE